MYIENIVIVEPLCSPELMFADTSELWESVEKEKTFFTNERFLPRILVDLKIYPSISEIRRNKPELMINLDKLDFIDGQDEMGFRVSKKRKLWILVGK